MTGRYSLMLILAFIAIFLAFIKFSARDQVIPASSPSPEAFVVVSPSPSVEPEMTASPSAELSPSAASTSSGRRSSPSPTPEVSPES